MYYLIYFAQKFTRKHFTFKTPYWFFPKKNITIFTYFRQKVCKQTFAVMINRTKISRNKQSCDFFFFVPDDYE